MGLLDDLTIPVPEVRPCKVRTIASELDPNDAKILLEAIDNPRWKIEPLRDALKAKNIEISSGTLKTHRTKACSCSKI